MYIVKTSFQKPKWPQTNCTHKKKQILGLVFHALSHGVIVIHFVAFECYYLERRPYMAVKEFQPVRRWFLELTPQQNWPHHVKGSAKRTENSISSCVPFCLRSLRHFERCDKQQIFKWQECREENACEADTRVPKFIRSCDPNTPITFPEIYNDLSCLFLQKRNFLPLKTSNEIVPNITV